MHWLNLPTRILHAPEYIGSEPPTRATWLCVILWCAEQENGGVIADARGWNDRRWQQTCGVTTAEVGAAAPLLTWEGDCLLVWAYPLDKEREVKAKREGGRKGGKSVSASKLSAVRRNGSLHLSKQSSTKAEPKLEPNGKERKGMERNIAPAGAMKTEKPTKARNPLLDTLAALDGSDPAQVTGSAWGGIAKALTHIREVCPEVTPAEITRRASNYRQHMRGAMLTAPALAKHWATCDHAPQQVGHARHPELREVK